ncbi:hypothetical protein RhiJN_15181 [Ceratobasidium sp. AG-Ba]|nr:hypothetical protein RhiJN_15181 [Ceratobasidium sp. AG-Ba]
MSVFRIPEIATSICSYLDRKDNVQFLLTSKFGLQTAAPLVWQLTPNNTHIGPDSSATPLKCDATPDRLRTYASYIKQLTVFEDYSGYIEIEGWPELLRHSQHSLLPSLRHLTLKTWPHHNPRDKLFWVILLACPSIINLQVLPIYYIESGTRPSIKLASLILRILVDRCPKLQQLAIHPSVIVSEELEDYSTHSRIPSIKSINGDHKPYVQYLKLFPELRGLNTSSTIFEPSSLRELAKLPHLRDLVVREPNPSVLKLDHNLHQDLGIDSFLSLENLWVYFTKHENLISMLSIRRMVEGLRSLFLSFGILSGNLPARDREPWIEKLLLCLDEMPNLKHLEISIHGWNIPGTSVHLSRLDAPTLAFFKLSLQCLQLTSIEFDPNIVQRHSFINMCPSVTCLLLPNQCAPPSVLVSLAELPFLEYLEVNLQIKEFNLRTHYVASPNRSLKTLKCSEHSHSVSTDEVDAIQTHARYSTQFGS